MGESIRRTTVICPKCGEDNAQSFRFCGMCGALLEARPPAAAVSPPLATFPPPVSVAPPRTAQAPEPSRPQMIESAPVASRRVPPISGPSMLGLDQPVADSAQSSPSVDSLREKSFSGLDSFLEPAEPQTGARRILWMIILLVALGGAGWWIYANYLGPVEGRKPIASVAPTTTSPQDKPAMDKSAMTPTPTTQDRKPESRTQEAAPVQATTSPASSAVVPETSSDNADVRSGANQKSGNAETRTAETTSAGASSPGSKSTARVVAKGAPPHKIIPKHEPAKAAKSVVKASASPALAAADTGEAAFRKGEAYLYGRGAPKNCDEAVKNLKVASAKSNAKARSTFGTMYATGHCVPRDLPTSYLWFALALRVDPNNQILEKDLRAIWNQMTPPERQMATRMKE